VDVKPYNEDTKCTVEVELKPIPPHLRCEFVGTNRTFPIIISAKLNGAQIEKLLIVL